ncbi:MAG: DUF937 domain-containing protein [Rhodobacteraceae bacterium]|nr:DUF937 domain-containing protein [Paracoccaceae bacterium]
MSILSLLQQAQNGQGLANVASQFGIGTDKAAELAEMLAPAISGAAKQKAASGGLDSLLGAFQGEAQGGLFDDATAAAAPEGQAQGAAFLDSLLGGLEGRAALEGAAAEKSGLDFSTVQKILPALAAMAQGGMQKNLPDASISSMLGGASSGGGGLLGMAAGLLGGGSKGGADISMLTNLLDDDGDGSVVDDILGKFLK